MATFIKECYLQKSLHYQILDALADKDKPIDPGKPIKLASGKDDDGKTVIVAPARNYKVGVLSDEDAKDIKPYILANWVEDRLYECKVYRQDTKATENKMISIAIYVKEFPQTVEQGAAHGLARNQED